jgi:hypothetical protein
MERRTSGAKEAAVFAAEGIPQRLKPNSLQSIYVRAEARTLHGLEPYPSRAEAVPFTG